LAIVAITAGFFIWKKNSSPRVIYKEYKVERGNLQVSILSTGTVQPENRLEIKSPVAGRIDQVLVEEGNKVRKGQTLAWMSSTERAALLDAARARGPEEVRRWEELYKPAPIIAPLAGTIILRNVEPGQTITASDAVFAMSDRLTVKAQVDETDIAKIKLHQKADIILDAYPDQTLSAQVDQIAYEAKTVNNVTTYVVDVLPEKAPDFMRSGMTANVRFQQESKDNILLLPAEAIILSGGKSKVMVKTEERGHPEEREVELGISDGKRTEITSGLEEGDVVVRVDLSKMEKQNSSNPFASPFNNRRPPSGGGGGGRR
jgi:macrolide-specific efflux system membrane fusion protein